MLKYDPAARISAKQAAYHEYFDDLDKTKLPAAAYDPWLFNDRIIWYILPKY